MIIRITEEDIERFTCGDCAILGVELEKASKGKWELAVNDLQSHVFVVKENMAMDIMGVHFIDEFLISWESVEYYRTTKEEICDYWYGEDYMDPFYGAYSFQRARVLAPYLLNNPYLQSCC